MLTATGRTIIALKLLLALCLGAQPQPARAARTETVGFRSDLVGQVLPYGVVLPADYDATATRYPVLYLLHGLTGNYSDWLSRTNLARYAARHRLIVVTPEGGDGWYTDSTTVPAEKYESYVVRELIADVDRRFRTLKDRHGRAIAGLSMGGYGALKFALKYPDQFAFAASLSGALDAAARTEQNPGFAWDFLRPSIMRTFGPAGSPARAANDLHRLVRDLAPGRVAALPFLYLDCGTEDGFLATNQELARLLAERRVPHEYRQLPGGHDWAYWDRQVVEVLRLAAGRMPAP